MYHFSKEPDIMVGRVLKELSGSTLLCAYYMLIEVFCVKVSLMHALSSFFSGSLMKFKLFLLRNFLDLNQ